MGPWKSLARWIFRGMALLAISLPVMAPAAQPSAGSEGGEAASGAEKATPQTLVIAVPFAPPLPAPPPAPPPPPPADRWLLMKALQGTWAGDELYTERTQVYGWTEMSFTASSVENNQLPMGFNYRANQFLLQQNWLRIDRSVVTSGTTEPTFGFRSDWILPGSDYRFTLARGLFSGQLTANNGRPELYGIDPIQFYAEAYFPTVGRGLDVKVGRCFCIYGVETNDAISNILASHAYAFIYDPFTHTGVLTFLKLTEAWTVQAGLMLGSDVFIDPADQPTFTGSVKWTQSDQRNSVLVSAIAGSGRFEQRRNFNNPEVLDVVFTHQFNPRLNYSYESLLGYQTHVPDLGTAWWYGALNYLTYNFTPRLSGTVRVEFFEDAQGQRTGSKGLYSAVTTGVNFRPRKSIIFRPELRYDHNDESRPFQDHHGLFTAAADLILRW